MSNPTLTDLLASYVPRLIQKRAIENNAPIESPISEEFQSVVLFADISGFTALTERLAERGAVGVENLARILNDYFGKMIEIIDDYGGDVVKFAGDALIVIWPIPRATSDPMEGSSHQWTLHAAECALKIRERMLGYKTEEGALYLKIALASGRLTQVHIGGVFNRWEFALIGEPLVELSIANNIAKADDIVLSPSSLALIDNDITSSSFDFEVQGQKQKAARLTSLKKSSQLAREKKQSSSQRNYRLH